MGVSLKEVDIPGIVFRLGLDSGLAVFLVLGMGTEDKGLENVPGDGLAGPHRPDYFLSLEIYWQGFV